MEAQRTYEFSLNWLIIGMVALAISGLFSIVLAVAWHPSFKEIEILATLFHRSLVAHVNLSITVWFLCGLLACWSYKNKSYLPFFNGTAMLLMLIAIIMMSAASLDPHATPLMSNYIPFLDDSKWFVLSLGCIVAATLIKVIEYFTQWRQPADFFITSNKLSLLMVLIALTAFAVSARDIAPHIDGEMRYEILFWGGGHVLQFIWVQALLIAWAVMLRKLVAGFTLHRGYRLTLWVNFAAVLTAPIPYLFHDVSSTEFRHLFTFLMSWVSGLAPVLFVLIFCNDAARGKHTLPRYRKDCIAGSLWWSLILFALGGAFAVMIDGINVKIPAHYHGSIVGVTMALMGFTYHVMITHGYSLIADSRMARWQPALLGIGQIMHITGLFWSGGYGVQRKTPNAEGEAIEQAELALRLMSTGGGIAIIGGLLFIIVILRAFHKGKTVLD